MHSLITRIIQLNTHQLIHPAANQHITVQQHNALKLPFLPPQPKNPEFRPRLLEARVLVVDARVRGVDRGHEARGDAARGEHVESRGREGCRVEGVEGVGGVVDVHERVVQGEETGEVVEVCD